MKGGNSRQIAKVGRDVNPLTYRTHRFSQWTKLGTIPSGSLNHYLAFSFALSDLPGAQETEFAAIFRSYRINRITVKFCPLANVATAQDWLQTGNTCNSMTSVAVCPNDDVVPGSEAEVLQFENVTLHPTIGQPWDVSFTPCAKVDTNNLNSMPVPAPWIDTGNVGVKHYGIKVCVPQTFGTQESIGLISMYVKYDIEFRTVC